MLNAIWGKNMSKKPLEFDNPNNTGRRLRCPRCKEILYPEDLETFCLCPYCEAKIENGEELEDFVIDPVIRQWMERYK